MVLVSPEEIEREFRKARINLLKETLSHLEQAEIHMHKVSAGGISKDVGELAGHMVHTLRSFTYSLKQAVEEEIARREKELKGGN